MGLFDSFQGNQFGNMNFLPGQSQQNYSTQLQQMLPQMQQAQQNTGTSTGPMAVPQMANTPSQPAQIPTDQAQGAQQSNSPVVQSAQNIMQSLSLGSPQALQTFISNPDFRKLLGQLS